MDPRTLPEAVLGRLSEDGTSTRFRFADESGAVIEDRSLAEVVDRARRIGRHLRGPAGLQKGDRVALAYAPSLDFVEAMLSCLLHGLVPCPLMPPDPTGTDAGPLAHVCRHAGAKAILTHQSYHRARFVGRVGRFLRSARGSTWPDLPWIVTDRVRGGTDIPIHAPDPTELAFLQYTSGSTAVPKGVRVTHGSLAHQLRFHHDINRSHRDSELLVWLPQYHDFGLICGILSALWGNGSLTLLSPFAFLRRPAAWMDAIHAVRATHTAAPNFGYELVLRKTTPAQRAAWDLSCMTSWCSAAEPVRADTVDRFLAAFAPSGVAPHTFHPAYGLAEHVVGVTVRGSTRATVDPHVLRTGARLVPSADPGATVLLGCGRPAAGLEVRIVDPETHRALPPDRVGEIWLHSESVCDGYEGAPERTEQVFRARLHPDDGRAWLRTGDLGALVEGELVVTGRLKELIIVRGRNVVPSDVEDAAQGAHPDIRPGGLVAFGYEERDGSEALGLIVEVRDHAAPAAESLARAVREAVRTEVPGITPAAVVIGRRGIVEKTTSGKVRRGACRDRFVRGALARDPRTLRIDRTDPGTSRLTRAPGPRALARLEQLVEEVLERPLEPDELDCSPAELGLDSLGVMALGERLEAVLGEPVPSSILLGARSLREVGDRLGLTGAPAPRPPTIFERAWSPAPDRGGALAPTPPPTAAPPRPRVLDVADADADPLGAIELCRRALADRVNQAVTVRITGSAAVSAEDEVSAGAAAVAAFVRTLRAADPAGAWRLHDVDPQSRATPVLLDTAPEVAVRGPTAYRPSRRPTLLGPSEADLPWGGRALVVGHGPRARATTQWLARSAGVEAITLVAPSPLSDADRHHVAALSSVGVHLALHEDGAESMPPGPWDWIVHAVPAPPATAAGRQTRARVRRAWTHGPTLLSALLAAGGPAARLVVVADLSSWFGGARHGAWAAASAAMAALTRAEATHRPATWLGVGPIDGEVPPRELSRLWRPEGVLPMTEPALSDALAQVPWFQAPELGLWCPLEAPTPDARSAR